MKTHVKKNKYLFLCFLIIIFSAYVSKFWFQFTLIQGDSMLPTYHNWQLVLIDKHTTNFSYGDVIVFTNDTLHSTLVKRIFALPGDTVQIIDGFLYVNGQPSPLLPDNTNLTYPGIAASSIYLADDEYFVLGDNHEFSIDSRYPEVGIIKLDTILGKVIK